jgi:hypothetical protein
METTKGHKMIGTENYVRMSDEDFEYLGRRGVSAERIAAMKATRDRLDRQARAEAARLDLWAHLDLETAERINSERL